MSDKTPSSPSSDRPAGQDTPPPVLSVVFPAFNEADNVGPLVDEICAALDPLGAPYEIVAADDCSADNTADVLEKRAEAGAPLRLIRHAARSGQSAAIVTAIRHARAPAIATLDGDGQNDPADIPALFKTWSDAADRDQLMVCGWRAKRKDTWIKRVSSRLANGIRGGLLRDDTPDTGCGLKVFPRDAFLRFPTFNHMHRYMPALMIRNGGRATSVKVNHRPRERGVSKYGTLDRLAVGIFDLVGVLWLIRRPLAPTLQPSDRNDGEDAAS